RRWCRGCRSPVACGAGSHGDDGRFVPPTGARGGRATRVSGAAGAATGGSTAARTDRRAAAGRAARRREGRGRGGGGGGRGGGGGGGGGGVHQRAKRCRHFSSGFSRGAPYLLRLTLLLRLLPRLAHRWRTRFGVLWSGEGGAAGRTGRTRAGRTPSFPRRVRLRAPPPTASRSTRSSATRGHGVRCRRRALHRWMRRAP